MNTKLAAQLKELLLRQPVAALATLHAGEPSVSMVPYAAAPDGESLVVYVSRLAAHTHDMLCHPKVGLLMMAPPTGVSSPHQLARVTLQGCALLSERGSGDHAQLRRAYETRFPHSVEWLDLPDFELFQIQPESVRFVGGFARAVDLSPREFAHILLTSMQSRKAP